ncbi:hypothetical protein ACPPVU_24080 [Mucilaginibacter sp. McL0603]|uniref:hypothetical protein n=1 Tax=Mucilaginibacter sp. McL0603 TaxID=3415670 RepID=UPI003CEB0BF9
MHSTPQNILSSFVILLIAVSLLSFIQYANVHTDGVYQSKPHQTGNEHSPYVYHYLRFFPNGKVISIASPGKPEDIKKWFADTNKYVSKGIYKINGNQINFQCISQQGKVNYRGEILVGSLILHVHSYFNTNHSTDEFQFVHD